MKSKKNESNPIEFKVIGRPKYTWECKLFGTIMDSCITLSVVTPPNWFWRTMQYLILGNKWKKLEPSKLDLAIKKIISQYGSVLRKLKHR